MRPFLFALLTLTAAAQTPAERWWSHVEFLASDKLEGRDTGSEGHRLAAQYVADQFARIGLQPAGTNGWFQPVPFEVRQIDEAGSSLTLLANGAETRLTLGKEAIIQLRPGSRGSVRAPLVFAGRGLQVPEYTYDDLRGLDLKGKIAVVLSDAPKAFPELIRAQLQKPAERWAALRRAGAVGVAVIANAQVPWARMAPARLQPRVFAAVGESGEEADQQIVLTINPEHAELLFAGTGHTLAELLQLRDSQAPLPRFALGKELAATVQEKRTAMESPNVAGLLPGRKKEYVVVTAHLDHVGKLRSFSGDGIFNGAMDNASGVASLIEVARELKSGKKPRRGVLFVAMTGEEKGLQGSEYFVKHPTVPRKRMVANFNLDTFLPLHPLRSLTVIGEEESTLGDSAREAAAPFGVPLVPDIMTNFFRFLQSDQYSFARAGIPAVAATFGYTKGSEEERIQTSWMQSRMHRPDDDAKQTVDKEAAARFTSYQAALAARVANARKRPAWKPGSYFRQYAR